jgi:hypothetical protein
MQLVVACTASERGVHNVPSPMLRRELGREIGVDRQPQRLRRPGERQLVLLDSIRSELKRRQDVGPLQLRVVAPDLTERAVTYSRYVLFGGI